MSEAAAEEAWMALCELDELPRLWARVFRAAAGDIAIFRTADDHVFALTDRCPHKGGPLSQGMVCGHAVTCPLHGWNIGLDDGHAVAPDVGHCDTFKVKVDNGEVYLAV